MLVTIEFCMAWNYTPRAASLAEALFTAFKPLVNKSHPIASVTLIPSGNGRFEVSVDGELIYSKAATGKHTTNDYIIQEMRARMKQRPVG